MSWLDDWPDENDVIAQAEWEIALELFEEEVKKAKDKIRAERKSIFPWRIKLININEE